MKYPYIGTTTDGTSVLFSAKKTGARIAGDGISELFGYSNRWNENAFADAGHHYLSNSYGKCESQEHADFICKLAENSDFDFCIDYPYSRVMGRAFFCFYRGNLYFFNESLASDDGRKIINLPLPPSKKEVPSPQVIESEQVSQLPKMEVDTPMPEVKNPKQEKPVYTKEMKKNGELPPVGSFVEIAGVSKVLERDFSPSVNCVIDLWGSGCVCEVICHTEIVGVTLPVLKYDNQVSSVLLDFIIPIPTLEDELTKLVRGHYDGTSKAKDLANKIISKYNITPKEEE